MLACKEEFFSLFLKKKIPHMRKHLFLLLFILPSCATKIQVFDETNNCRAEENIVDELVPTVELTKGFVLKNHDIDRGCFRLDSVSAVYPKTSTYTKSQGDEPLLYLVYYNEGRCAVADANDLESGIICIIEDTNLSVNHFFNDDWLDNAEGDISQDLFPYYLADLISSYVLSESAQKTKSDFSWDGIDWTTTERRGPFVKTIWHQFHPFNHVISLLMHETVAAGCVPVALAQICAYNRFPTDFEGNDDFSWESVRRVYSYYGGTYSMGSDVDQVWASFVVAMCGLYSECNFGSSESSTTTSKAKDALEILGYTNVRTHTWANVGHDMDYYVTQHLRTNRPAYYSGRRITNGLSTTGHAWVVDGLWILTSQSDDMVLYHANFGWGGPHNGWYKAGMFNTSRNMISYTPSIGDSYAPNDDAAGRNYNLLNDALTYSIP